MGYTKARTGRDGSKKYDQYLIACDKKALAMNEYGTRLASVSSTHVLQLDDLQAGIDIDWKSNFHELVLAERPGRSRHSFSKKCDIKQIAEHFKDSSEQHKAI